MARGVWRASLPEGMGISRPDRPSWAALERNVEVTEPRWKELISQGKGPKLDWHPQNVLAPTLAASLVAMANSTGGAVLVGLTPRSGRFQGLPDPQATMNLALEAALSVTPPLIIPLPKVITLDGRALLSITVPPGLPHVYSIDGQYLIRDGARNRSLSPSALRRLMMARGELSWEAQIPKGVTLDDLDWETVATFTQEIDALRDVSPEKALLRRGCLAERGDDRLPTFAGLLLFGCDPQRWVRGAEIEAARFSGREMSDAFVRQTIGGTLPHQLRQAEAFLVDQMRAVVQMGTSLKREEWPEYPPEAVREALVNAVAHRDYAISGDQIRAFLFADRLEVTSPGHLPGPVTVDNIADERFSRNEVIVQVLADMGFIERLGYGIDRMIRLMGEYRLPAPRFEETAGGFRVTLLGSDDAPQLTPRSSHDGGASKAEESLDLSAYRHLELNLRQEKALTFLLSHRHITNREFQTLCPEVHPETLRRDLVDLVRKDVLLKVGDKRATYYILKKPAT
jgi:ATP-dependent DNA helicase RecG